MNYIKPSFTNIYLRFDAFIHDSFRRNWSKHYSINQLKDAKPNYKNWKKLTRNEKKEIVSYWGIKDPRKSDFITHEIMLNVHGKFDVRYCPEKIFRVYLDPGLSDRKIVSAWDDKNYFELHQPNLPFPKTILRNVNGYFLDSNYSHVQINDAKDIILNNLPVIIKPSIDSGEGKNLRLISHKDEVDDVLNNYKKNYIVQELIIQCDEFKKLSPKSVNAMRVVTAIINGKAVLLSSVLLCNTTDSIACNKNVSAGVGVVIIGIDENGKLDDIGYFENAKQIQTLPNGVKFGGIKVPSYKKVIELALKAHESMPMLGIIGWDITVDKDDNPIFIEWNLRGIGMYHSQLATGPLFGEYSQQFADISKKLIQNWKKK